MSSLYPDLGNLELNDQPRAATRRSAPQPPTAQGQFPTLHADGVTAIHQPFQYGFGSQARTFQATQLVKISDPTPPGWALLTVSEANLIGNNFFQSITDTVKLQNGRIEAHQCFENNENNEDCTLKLIGQCVNPDEADGRRFDSIIRISNAVATPPGWAVLTVAEAKKNDSKVLDLLLEHETARLTNGKVQDKQILTQLVLAEGEDLSECSHKVIGKCSNPDEADLYKTAEPAEAPTRQPSAPSEASFGDEEIGKDGFNQFSSDKNTGYKDSSIEVDSSTIGTDTGMPIIKNAKTIDDFAGFTAHPLLKHLCNANVLRLRHFFENKHTKFEIRTDDSPHVFVQGKEEESMINGFTLKVLSLGIVKTKFELSLSDNSGQKMITIIRPIGASTFLQVYLEYFGKHEFIGKIQPTGFNLNRISYNIYDENARHVYTFQGGMLRGLFSDGYELVNPNKKSQKFAKYARNGDISFTGKDKEHLFMKHRMLIMAAGMIMKLHI